MPDSKTNFIWRTPLDEIKSSLSSTTFPILRQIIVGVNFCAVRTTDDIVGLSFTSTDLRKPPIRRKYPLVDRSWQELLYLFLSNRPTERSLGLATVNALSQTILRKRLAKQLVDDGSSWLPNPANLKIGMIGAIHSVLRRIVTEKGEVLLRDDTLRQRQCHRLPKNGINLVSSVDELKNVDHLLVTGSAIIHKDIGKILAILPFIQGERVLIGPSAQILPQAAFKDGFTIIASSWVEQVKETMQNISEGGGYHIFQKYCRKYVIRKPKIP